MATLDQNVNEVKSEPGPTRTVEEIGVKRKVESINDLIGSWGKFQFRMLLIMLLVYLCSALNNSGMEAYMKRSDFYCEKANSSEVRSGQRKCINFDQFLEHSSGL